MKIVITPETEAEKKKVKAVEHTNVKEFFIFGNKGDDESDLVDFHDWSAGRRYMVYSLEYFKSVILAEEKQYLAQAQAQNAPEIDLTPKPKMVKHGAPNEQKVNVLEFPTGGLMPGEDKPLPVVEAVEVAEVAEVADIKMEVKNVPEVEAEVIEEVEVTEEAPPKPTPPPNELIAENKDKPSKASPKEQRFADKK